MTNLETAVPIDRPRRRRRPFVDLLVRLFRDKPLGALGGTIFVAFLLAGIFADVLAPEGQNEPHLSHRLEAPSSQFPMGTDHLGRDVFSRVLIAGRLSMIIGIVGAGLATAISIVLGILSGYFGGMLDLVIQRLVDAWMTFPPFVLLLVFISIVGPGVPQIAGILALIFGIAGSRSAWQRHLGPRAHVHARGTVDRCRLLPYSAPAHSAEHHACRDRAVHDPCRCCDPLRGWLGVSWPGSASSTAYLGWNAEQ